MTKENTDLIHTTVQELEGVLIRERNKLLGEPGESLDALAASKNSLLDTLTRLTRQRAWEKTAETVDAIGRCHSINKENAQLVNQRLKITRQSLDIVRQHLGDGATVLYDTSGKLDQRIETRNYMKV